MKDLVANEPLHIRSADHPEADGKRPEASAQAWTFDLEVEGGRRLFLSMGRESRDNFSKIVLDERIDTLECPGCKRVNSIGEICLCGYQEPDTASADYIQRVARVARSFLATFDEFFPDFPEAIGEPLDCLQTVIDGHIFKGYDETIGL